MDELQHFLAAFGPVAILLGAAFEGQTAVIAGGVLAREHVISPWVAFAAAALGSAALDYGLFVLGRSFRQSRLVQKAAAKPTFAKAISLIERFPSGFILGFRFLYGLRAAGPVAIGVTQVGKTHFAVLNAIGAMIWSGVFVGLGYVCGPAVMTVLQGVAAHAGPVIAAAVVAGVVGGLAIWAARERLSP